MLTDQIGKLLKSSRKALGLTQKELAFRAEVSERLWAEVERGERPNVSLATALRMLSEVGISVRLDHASGASHTLDNPAATATARAARAAIRRATWNGRQIRLAQEGDEPAATNAGAGRLAAVTRVSEQAFAVARARRASRS